MLDINKELELILSAHGLTPWEKQSFQGDAIDYLRTYFQTKYAGKRVAIRGAGKYAQQILRHFGDVLMIIGIYDREPGEGLLAVVDRQYPVYPLTALGEHPFDYIIHGVLLHRDAVREELTSAGYGQQIIEVEQLLQGSPYQGRGYFLWEAKDTLYTDGYTLWNRLAGQAVPGGPVLWQLIRWLFSIRDLCTAKELLRDYSWLPEDEGARCTSLLSALQGLEDRIREALAEKETRDVVVFLHDMLAYEGLPSMTWLSQKIGQSWYYEQIYSAADYTVDSVRNIMGGFLSIDNAGQSGWEHPLLSLLEQQGYTPTWIAFPKKELLPPDQQENKSRLTMFSQNVPCPLVIWDCYDQLITGKGNQFLWLHFFLEAHGYNRCPMVNTQVDPGYFGLHRQRSIAYVDVQMAYCNTILSNRTVQIHTSDHGFRYPAYVRRGSLPPQDSRITRVFLMAFGGGVPQARVNQIASLGCFVPFLSGILSQSYDQLAQKTTSESIPIQFRDPYFVDYAARVIASGSELEVIAHRATRRLHDLFICNALGQEFYYRLPDEQTNYIDDPRYQEEIAYLREKTGKHFIDIDANDEYIHSRKLYKSIEEKYGLKKIY